MKARFEFLLGEILRQPSVPVRALQIMPNAELNKILFEFNDTATDYSTDKSILQLFEEPVKKTPDKPAIVYNDTCMTFAELDSASTKLAHLIKEIT
jgi:non-ribosomal peptide synthetase component F